MQARLRYKRFIIDKEFDTCDRITPVNEELGYFGIPIRFDNTGTLSPGEQMVGESIVKVMIPEGYKLRPIDHIFGDDRYKLNMSIDEVPEEIGGYRSLQVRLTNVTSNYFYYNVTVWYLVCELIPIIKVVLNHEQDN